MQKDILKARGVRPQLAHSAPQHPDLAKQSRKIATDILNVRCPPTGLGVPDPMARRIAELPFDGDVDLALASNRLIDQLLKRSVCNDFSVVQDNDACALLLCLFQMMCRQEQGGTVGMEILQHLKDALSALGINTHCRFIQYQQLRAMHHTAGDIDTTLHAARKAAYQVMPSVA
jgi:hypothetical protein